jgi:hypothetical protein
MVNKFDSSKFIAAFKSARHFPYPEPEESSTRLSTYLFKIHSNIILWAAIAQSVQWLATGYAVQGSNPGCGEISRTRPDRPWGSPSFFYNRYLVKILCSLIFWDLTLRTSVSHRRFGTTYQSRSRILSSSGMFLCVGWLRTDVSELLIGPIFKGQDLEFCRLLGSYAA